MRPREMNHRVRNNWRNGLLPGWLLPLFGVLSIVSAARIVGAEVPSYAQVLPPHEHTWPDVTIVATGQHAALARVEVKYQGAAPGRRPRPFAQPLPVLAYHAHVGVRRMQFPRAVVWYGLGPGDAVFAADKGGQLWRAESVEHAAQGQFRKLGRVPKASNWDYNYEVPDMLVAVAGRAWFASHDGGHTFVKHGTASALEGLYVRRDRVLVLDPKGAPPQVSHDAGATWTAAPDEVGDLQLRRDGNWIGEAVADHAAARCRNGVLAEDGRTWRGWYGYKYASHFPDGTSTAASPSVHDAWAGYFTDRAYIPALANALEPSVVETVQAVNQRCETHQGLGGLIGGVGRGGPGCDGLDCLAPLEVNRREPVTRITILNDDRCAPAPDGRCLQPAAPRADQGRTPVLFDARRGTVVLGMPRPPGCGLLESLDDGVAVVSCQHPQGHELRALTSSGAWVAIGVTNTAMRTVAVEPDGTLLFASACRVEPSCAVHMRAPGEFTPAGPPLLVLAVPRARAVRRLPGGDWLVITEPEGVPPASFVTQNAYMLATILPEAARKDLAACALSAQLSGEVAVRYDVGNVTYAGPAPLVACARRVLGDRSSKKGRDSDTLYFRQRYQAFDVVRVARGALIAEPIRRVGERLEFEGGLYGVRVDAEGVLHVAAKSRAAYAVDAATGQFRAVST